MNVKITLVLFAVATLLQLSHCIPTHRYARGSPDFGSKIKEYFNKIPNYGSSSGSGSQSNQPQTPTYTGSGSSNSDASGTAAAASEPEASITTKAGSSTPDFSSYIPSQFSQYQPQMPNYTQYFQFPSQMQGFPSGTGSTAAASEPEASIAAKAGSSTPDFSSYIPSQFSQYQPQMPQMPQTPQMPQMPQTPQMPQMPQSFNPGSYMNSKSIGS